MAIAIVRGMSWPFRIGATGGVVMSEANGWDVAHFDESIKHILTTERWERVMMPEFYTALKRFIFDRNDISVQSLIKFEIVRAISLWETRVTVTENSIDLVEDDSILYAIIRYTVNSQLTAGEYTVSVPLQEV